MGSCDIFFTSSTGRSTIGGDGNHSEVKGR